MSDSDEDQPRVVQDEIEAGTAVRADSEQAQPVQPAVGIFSASLALSLTYKPSRQEPCMSAIREDGSNRSTGPSQAVSDTESQDSSCRHPQQLPGSLATGYARSEHADDCQATRNSSRSTQTPGPQQQSANSSGQSQQHLQSLMPTCSSFAMHTAASAVSTNNSTAPKPCIVEQPSSSKAASPTPSTATTGTSSSASSASMTGSARTSSSRLSSLVSMNSTAQHYFEKKIDPSTCSQCWLDEEEGLHEPVLQVPERRRVRTHEYASGVIVILLVALMGWVLYNSTTTVLRLRVYYAFAIFPFLPLGVIFFAFAMSTVIRGLMYIGFGGTSPLDQNSQNYSAVKTPIRTGTHLPQVVVQMPVYKESLEEVIKPSYLSVRRAMQYYQEQGGKVKFVICDDGFQVIPTDDAIERASFYAAHNITFVARPPVNRRGVFKKASNLNYQLAASERINALIRENAHTSCDEALLALWEEWDKEFVAGGDLSMDEDCLILLIDADTRVPESCMYDVIGEFTESPELAYTQHCTEPFAEQCRNYWEQHISHFTRIIYMQAIAVPVAYGDCAPLVGHNAFLRWSAVKQIGYQDESCRLGQIKYWSESCVSEDFDMYIRLASIGSFGRYVIYTGPDFQEGVSLTYMDEIIKFKKFAYGACEILFHPFKYWLTQGPFSRTFLTYLATKNIAWYQKVSIICYLSSYLAMGAAFYYCLFEGVMSVVDPKFHDYFLTRSFDVMLTCNVIFTGMGTVCGEVFFQWRRLGDGHKANFFVIAWNQIKWLPSTVIFFYSALFPMTEACFMYLFSVKAAWGATVKTTAKTTAKISCWKALRDTLVAYKWEYILYLTLLIGYLVVAVTFKVGLYRAWAIPSYCIGHIVGPIVLNPTIMSFAW